MWCPPSNSLLTIAVVSCVMLAAACTPAPQSEKPAVEPAARPVDVRIEATNLWKSEYDPVELDALRKSQNGDVSKANIDRLCKLSAVHYNNAIASLNSAELHNHVEKGEVVTRVAMQSYLKARLPRDNRDFTELLHRLALFEEKIGDFEQGQQLMKTMLSTNVSPPYTKMQIFALKMDLARMYLDGRKDTEAAELLNALLAEFKKNPAITDSRLILYDNWLKAQERVNTDPEKFDRIKKQLQKLKRERAEKLLQDATNEIEAEEAAGKTR